MATQATYDDVNLVLKLYELRREEKLRQARQWFVSAFKVKTMEDFNSVCPMGSDQNAYFRMVVSYWDMAASFITSGVLNETLFYQNSRELLFVWERIRDVVCRIRETFKDPTYLRNLEAVADSFIVYLDRQEKGIYPAFSARVRGS